MTHEHETCRENRLTRHVTLIVLLATVSAFAMPAALAETCDNGVCVSDERSGDHSTPCEYGTQHDPRYRYLNASANAQPHDIDLTLTFACKSNPPNGEWFYGNLTYTDGARRDVVTTSYYYGELYWGVSCGVFVRANPDPVAGQNFDRLIGGYYDCPNAGDYPSVTSTLP